MLCDEIGERQLQDLEARDIGEAIKRIEVLQGRVVKKVAGTTKA